MHRDSSAEAIELVSSIHLLFSNRDDEVVDDAFVYSELLRLLNNAHGTLVVGDSAGEAPSPKSSASTASWVYPKEPLILELPSAV